ncbi:MAG: geranylgeranylglycerol-phosphate geranylgeranyltransferase [Saprospiraceae bacterium]|nr:geranylgeranylglycerol-phosphate geranylgeranyltransferase [Saprospiraceae bacterium]
MNALLAIIRLLRLPNLVIVFLTQCIPYWLVLRPAILRAGGIPVLTPNTFGLIALATVLTTLAGYLLNDYYDRNIDAINKPRRVVWGKYLPASIGLLSYASVLALVHILAFYIDFTLRPHSHWPLLVFPGVSFMLFLYAWQLKCTAIIGNLLVSILCALVPIILLLPEDRPIWLSSFQQPERMQEAVSLVYLYALFAFVTNLMREQVKDLEDFMGDSACGCNTLAVMRGPRFAKKPAAFTGLTAVILITILLFFWQQTGAPLYQIIAGGLLLLLPSLIATVLVFRATGPKDFSTASLYVKIVMFAGLFLLLRSIPANIGLLGY